MSAVSRETSISLSSHQAELSASAWSPRLLAARLPAVLDMADELPPAQRLAWLTGLRQVWQRHAWAMSPATRRDLLQLARAWCDWPLAGTVGDSLLEADALDAEAALWLLEAWAMQGEFEAACDLAVHWQLALPADARFAEAHRLLTSWQARCAEWPEFADDMLSLTPLAHQHVHGFAWAYHDPAIAELCRLPAFQDADEWHAWLDGRYDDGDEWPLAIIHRDWGLVGCVHLILVDDLGFLFYWLAPDFRGQGIAQRACALLLDQLPALRACYAKVYADNAPSRRLLARLGFCDLGIHAAPPDEDELFYRRGEPAARETVVAELHELMQRMGSQTRVAAVLGGVR